MIDLEIADTAFEKYARYGMSLLKDLTWYFQEAEPQARRKLLGSIFPAKLTFQDGNYRTSALNPALALILQKNKGLQNEKAEDIAISENVSGDVARTGILSGGHARRMSRPESRFPPLPTMRRRGPRVRSRRNARALTSIP